MTKTLKTEMRDITSLTSDPDNARARGPRALEAIANSLKVFGQQKPIVVSPSGVVIAGNGTLDAAKQLGWAKIAVQVTALTGAEQRAYAIADNRTAELAFWNDERLIATLHEIGGKDEELLSATGFSPSEIEGMRAAADEEEEPASHNIDGQGEKHDDTADAFDSEESAYRVVASFNGLAEAEDAVGVLRSKGIDAQIIAL
jgi:ParB-like chromosome segregation protein Spo0J